MTAPRPLGTPVPWEGGSASLTRGRRARAQAAARALLPVPVAAARAVAAEPRGGGRPAQAAQGVLQALRRGGQRAAGRGGPRHDRPHKTPPARKPCGLHGRTVLWQLQAAPSVVMPLRALLCAWLRRQRRRACGRCSGPAPALLLRSHCSSVASSTAFGGGSHTCLPPCSFRALTPPASPPSR